MSAGCIHGAVACEVCEPQQSGPIAIGDEKFLKRLASAGMPRVSNDNFVDDEGKEHLVVTVDKEGNLVNPNLPENILAQLSTPEAKAMMAKQFRESRNPKKDPPRPMRYVNEREDRRLFIDRKPPGMDSREWRRFCRAEFRKNRKKIVKLQRSINHGKRTD